MAKFYQTREFSKLNSEWDAILKKSKFIDHEKIKNGERVLIKPHNIEYKEQAKKEAINEYFRTLCNKVYQTRFPNDIHRTIMIKRSEGWFLKKITDHLCARGDSIHRKTVAFIIRRYEYEWGMRFWTLKQRNLKKNNKKPKHG